jgi:hypothetical protein
MTAQDRIWAEFDPDARAALEQELIPTDLQTLLLAVSRARAAEVTPARLMRRWREDRFVQPSAHDPRVLAQVEARLWSALPERFAGVELSPVAPLGTCSAIAPVDQNRVVSTVRGSEVVSDSTNALALEAAARRKGRDRRGRVDLAASHRVIRAQVFGAGLSAHFRLFALVSSARDRGSGATHADLLIDHLAFWSRALADLLPHRRTMLTFTSFDSPVLRERFEDTVRPALARGTSPVPLVEDAGRTQGLGYYTGAAVGLRAFDGDDVVGLGDGGFTTWTSTLLGDAKERCLISCVATERLAALMA